jgi:hypothetical protein
MSSAEGHRGSNTGYFRTFMCSVINKVFSGRPSATETLKKCAKRARPESVWMAHHILLYNWALPNYTVECGAPMGSVKNFNLKSKNDFFKKRVFLRDDPKSVIMYMSAFLF